MSRPSMLPRKRSAPARQQQLVGVDTTAVPLAGLLADREQADVRLRQRRAGPRPTSVPMCANCTRCSGRGSTLAPASISSTGPAAAGSGGTAGRRTPGRRSSSSRPAATHGARLAGRHARGGAPLAHGGARRARARRRRARARRPGRRRGPIDVRRVLDVDARPARCRPRRLDRRLVAEQQQRAARPAPRPARARDGRRRRPVAAHRVERDPHRRPARASSGVRCAGYSRPRYVPQTGHTRCDSFGEWQVEQAVVFAASTPCWARRRSRRDFDVFFLGTAIGAAAYRTVRARRAAGRAAPTAAGGARSQRGSPAVSSAARAVVEVRAALRRTARGSPRGTAPWAASRGRSRRSPSGRCRAPRPARYSHVMSSSAPGSGWLSWYSSASIASVTSASSRQRWHGPRSVTLEAQREEQPASGAA